MNYKSPDVKIISAADVNPIPPSSRAISDLAEFVLKSRLRRAVPHTHVTTTDTRIGSWLEKTEGLYQTDFTHDGVDYFGGYALDTLYEALPPHCDEIFGQRIQIWLSRAAAMGHVFDAGSDSGEGHRDQFPSATWYLEAPSKGGELVVSRDPHAQSLAEIDDSDPFIVTPEKGTVAVFDGRVFPHYVRSVEEGRRISINFSYNTQNGVEIDDLPPAMG